MTSLVVSKLSGHRERILTAMMTWSPIRNFDSVARRRDKPERSAFVVNSSTAIAGPRRPAWGRDSYRTSILTLPRIGTRSWALMRARATKHDETTVDKVYGIFQDWFRPRRMRKVVTRSHMWASTTVLDIGGNDINWQYVDQIPQLTLLNLDLPSKPSSVARCYVVADGCQLPFADDTFDLAFSNSVIEHVPDHEAFAREVVRVGRSYYVQTPNKWFPIEPHLMAPLVHFLPRTWQRRLSRHFTLWGLIARPTTQQLDDFHATTRLLDTREMRRLFPNTVMEKERVLGLTKSISVWGGDRGPDSSHEAAGRAARTPSGRDGAA